MNVKEHILHKIIQHQSTISGRKKNKNSYRILIHICSIPIYLLILTKL